jgi:methionyl-tRNA formyltransferase
MTLRIAFMGSSVFGLPALEALIGAGREIVCVYTQPPRPSGRGRRERSTPIHSFAAARGIDVRTPRSLKRPEEHDAFRALNLDLAIVAAYGLILPKPILAAPRLGCINLHASLLPRWRGAAPIQRAIMADDRITGVMVMRMEEGLDTGPILLSAETPILAADTAGALHDRLAALAAPLCCKAVDLIERNEAHEVPQAQEGVVYAPKIIPEETRIDWSQPAWMVDCRIRGLSPSPGAWFVLPHGTRIKPLMSRCEEGIGEAGTVLDDTLLIACGEGGAVRLLEVQREGRAAMAAADFLRGSPLPAGTRLA